MNIFDELSPNELRILEYFAKKLKTAPQQLKESLLDSSIIDRAKTLAFIQARVPKLYEDIKQLLESEEE